MFDLEAELRKQPIFGTNSIAEALPAVTLARGIYGDENASCAPAKTSREWRMFKRRLRFSPQPLKRYYFDYFDIRDGDAIASDEEGVEFPDIKAAQDEAAQALADVARDVTRGFGEDSPNYRMSIEVRDGDGPVLRAKLVLDFVR
ncbi:hypothetical protein [Bradyrhizobium sp. ISRA463]|uniref:DUF6894 family protein n=1 Tax=unclassified Bradyrhizobium TaxID=2631580 RepID=UPI0032B04225